MTNDDTIYDATQPPSAADSADSAATFRLLSQLWHQTMEGTTERDIAACRLAEFVVDHFDTLFAALRPLSDGDSGGMERAT